MNFTQMYTSVKLAKQGLEGMSNILAAREAGVLLHTCPRSLPSATSVVKFLSGRSLHPENYTEKSNPCSQMLPKRKNSSVGTGLIQFQ